MKRNKLRRVTATALLLSFALPQCAQAAAPTVETDETVYINMDYYGAPTNTRIVKGVNLNGHTEFTDFGDYKDVYNMSTFDEPGPQGWLGLLEAEHRQEPLLLRVHPERHGQHPDAVELRCFLQAQRRSGRSRPVRRRERHHSDGHSRRARTPTRATTTRTT